MFSDCFTDISNEAKFLCPEDYSRRCQNDNSDPVHHSLPSSPSPVDLKKLSRILTSRRQQLRGASQPSFGFSCKQGVLLALALLIIKGAICLLIYFPYCYYNSITPPLFSQVLERLFVYFTNFKSIGMPEKILVSNYAVLALVISVCLIAVFRRVIRVRNS